MAEITNPEAINYVNTILRPLAERTRDLAIMLHEAKAIFVEHGMAAYFANDIDTVEDGRESEGIRRLTAKDVNDFIDVGGDILLVLEATGVPGIVRKPCVRQLHVGG